MNFNIKNYAKSAVEWLLCKLVTVKLRRTHPVIIGITGSYGKTTVKDAVAHILSSQWNVCKSSKSLNTEIGLLLSVLEQASGFQSPAAWMAIITKAFWNAFFSKPCDFMVLEYGADKPGDIDHLVNAVKPDIAVITHIARTHQDKGQFRSTEEVFAEKQKLVTSLNKNGIAILNADDELLKKMRGGQMRKILWFSKNEAMSNQPVDIAASELKNDVHGFYALIRAGSKQIRAFFPIVGSFHISTFLPALLVGKLNGIDLEEGIKALQSFKLPPGRMSVIEGKNGSTLLDSSYNASPETVKECLVLLKDFPGKRKIAVLGNMNELGEWSEAAHRGIVSEIDIPRTCPQIRERTQGVGYGWLEQLITVGEAAAMIADECLKKGMPNTKIKTFVTAEEAAQHLLRGGLHTGDVILLKGSQNRVRLERAVKLLMDKPKQAAAILCRQEKIWQKIP
jgi:UDP-N-acetylmuramoyl-tripeptide--D-alanyl-D-alanine ligase